MPCHTHQHNQSTATTPPGEKTPPLKSSICLTLRQKIIPVFPLTTLSLFGLTELRITHWLTDSRYLVLLVSRLTSQQTKIRTVAQKFWTSEDFRPATRALQRLSPTPQPRYWTTIVSKQLNTIAKEEIADQINHTINGRTIFMCYTAGKWKFFNPDPRLWP